MGTANPTKADLEAARGRSIPDVLAEGLDVVFVGINPGLWSGAVGHHFARPGNRFWKALHGAGFTERVLDPTEDASLLERGLGVTNLVNRTTATAAELTDDEAMQRKAFQRLRAVQQAGQQAGHALPELSMGMSGDYGVAVEEGATLIRLGTLLFGARDR